MLNLAIAILVLCIVVSLVRTTSRHRKQDELQHIGRAMRANYERERNAGK